MQTIQVRGRSCGEKTDTDPEPSKSTKLGTKHGRERKDPKRPALYG
jgi:hypothetical protein